MKVQVVVLLISSLILFVSSQNWNRLTINEDSQHPLAIRQNAYSPMIIYNWYKNQSDIDANTPEDVYFLRTFAAGATVELGYINGIAPNVFSLVNGGVDRPGLYTISDVFTYNLGSAYNHTLVGHTLTQVRDPRLTQFYYLGVNFGGVQENGAVNSKVHFFQTPQQFGLSFGERDFPSFPRVFHTSIAVEGDATRIGYMYIWGGISDLTAGVGTYRNELLKLSLPLLTDGSSDFTHLDMVSVTQSGTIPSVRAGHSAIYYNGNMIIFGGFDGNSTFNTIYTCDITTATWSTNSPAPIKRSFHSGSLLGDKMYVFGGVEGSTLYNDLYSYDIINDVWKQVELEFAPPPRAGHTGFVWKNKILIQGGSNNVIVYDDWWFLEVDGPFCQYFCNDVMECVSSARECDSYRTCTDDKPFRCASTCQSDPADCPISETCSADEVLCWNGYCSPNITLCTPYPSCPIGVPRCNDGTCSSTCSGETLTECADGLLLCIDGSCAEECTPYFGCSTDKRYLCPDSSCVEDPSTCGVELCSSGGFDTCWDGACRDPCSEAYWRRPVNYQRLSIAVEAGDSSFPFDVYQEGVAAVDLNQPVGISLIIVFNNGTEDLDLSATVRPTPASEVFESGPHPYWGLWFNHSYYASPVVTFEIDGIDPEDIDAQFFVKEDPTRDRDLPYCLGFLVDWYWDEMDANSWGPLANYSLFAEYVAIMANETDSTDDIPTQVAALKTPAKRWRCAFGEQKFISSTPAYSEFKGIVMETWGPVALIRNLPKPTEPYIAPVTYPVVQWIIFAIWAAAFVIFLSVLIFQIATSDG